MGKFVIFLHNTVFKVWYSMCIIYQPFILLWGMCDCLVYKVWYSITLISICEFVLLVHKVFISFYGENFSDWSVMM